MRGAWVVQLIKRLTSAQVMISWFVSSSPASDSVLTAWSLEPGAWNLFQILCLPLSAAPWLMLCLSLKSK